MTTQSKLSGTTSHLLEVRHLIDDIQTFIDKGTLDEIVNHLRYCRTRVGHVYVVGNGGSSNNASHFAAHLCDVGIRATCLTDNVGLLTARSNDTKYGLAFVESIPVITSSDVLVAFSCSGQSENVKEALRFAHKEGARTIAFFGFRGEKGQLRKHIDAKIVLDAKNYGAVEDAHSIVVHLIKDLLT